MKPPKFDYSKNFRWDDLEILNLTDIAQTESFLRQVAKSFSKGHRLIENVMPTHVYFILEGQIKAGRYNSNDELQTLFLLQSGDVFGLQQLHRENATPLYAETLTETTLAVLPTHAVKEMMNKNAAFNSYIMQQLFKKAERLENHFNRLISLTSRQRIIYFLLNQIEERGQRVGYEYVSWTFFIHRDIAELTKTSRQTVTTTLNKLKRKNIIEFNRRRLLVRDMEQLKKEALIEN